MGTRTDAALAQVVAARADFDAEVDRLEAAGRAAVDIPAKIRREPVKAAGVAAGAAFLAARRPEAAVPAGEARDPRRGGAAALPSRCSPTRSRRPSRSSAPTASKVRGTLEREFAKYLDERAKERKKEGSWPPRRRPRRWAPAPGHDPGRQEPRRADAEPRRALVRGAAGEDPQPPPRDKPTARRLADAGGGGSEAGVGLSQTPRPVRRGARLAAGEWRNGRRAGLRSRCRVSGVSVRPRPRLRSPDHGRRVGSRRPRGPRHSRHRSRRHRRRVLREDHLVAGGQECLAFRRDGHLVGAARRIDHAGNEDHERQRRHGPAQERNGDDLHARTIDQRPTIHRTGSPCPSSMLKRTAGLFLAVLLVVACGSSRGSSGTSGASDVPATNGADATSELPSELAPTGSSAGSTTEFCSLIHGRRGRGTTRGRRRPRRGAAMGTGCQWSGRLLDATYLQIQVIEDPSYYVEQTLGRRLRAGQRNRKRSVRGPGAGRLGGRRPDRLLDLRRGRQRRDSDQEVRDHPPSDSSWSAADREPVCRQPHERPALYFPGDERHRHPRPEELGHPRGRSSRRAPRPRRRRGGPGARRRTRVPGFRPGKAPRRVLEAVLGPGAVLDEAVDRLVQGAYRDALIEQAILPLTNADVEIVQAEEGKPLIFKATVQVRPGGRARRLQELQLPARDRDDRRREGRQGHRGAARPERRPSRRSRNAAPRRATTRSSSSRAPATASRSRAGRPSGCR